MFRLLGKKAELYRYKIVYIENEEETVGNCVSEEHRFLLWRWKMEIQGYNISMIRIENDGLSVNVTIVGTGEQGEIGKRR